MTKNYKLYDPIIGAAIKNLRDLQCKDYITKLKKGFIYYFNS